MVSHWISPTLLLTSLGSLISSLVVRFGVIFADQNRYRELLKFKGPDSQTLFDLLQSVRHCATFIRSAFP
jgi:hypothetical protein